MPSDKEPSPIAHYSSHKREEKNKRELQKTSICREASQDQDRFPLKYPAQKNSGITVRIYEWNKGHQTILHEIHIATKLIKIWINFLKLL